MHLSVKLTSIHSSKERHTGVSKPNANMNFSAHPNAFPDQESTQINSVPLARDTETAYGDSQVVSRERVENHGELANRVPVFGYLADYRERTLVDIVNKLEPGLFKVVTGLDEKEFDLLVRIGVLNRGLMNDAIYKFKRYEDASLNYSGIDKHQDNDIGLYDSVLSSEDYKQTFTGLSYSK